MKSLIQLKCEYADFISAQLEQNAEYLPTFLQWEERRRQLQELMQGEKQNFSFKSDILGLVTLPGFGATEDDRYYDAQCRLRQLENKHAQQNGGKGNKAMPKSREELLAEELEESDKRTENLNAGNDKLRARIEALNSKLQPK